MEMDSSEENTAFDEAVYEERTSQKLQKLEATIELARKLMVEVLQLKAQKLEEGFVNPFGGHNKKEVGKKIVARKEFRNLQYLELNFPRFEGKAVEDWLQDCEQYFEIFGVSDDKKVAIAGLHLEGVAKRWNQVYTIDNTILEWDHFAKQFAARFGMMELPDASQENYTVEPIYDEKPGEKHEFWPEQEFILAALGGDSDSPSTLPSQFRRSEKSEDLAELANIQDLQLWKGNNNSIYGMTPIQWEEVAKKRLCLSCPELNRHLQMCKQVRLSTLPKEDPAGFSINKPNKEFEYDSKTKFVDRKCVETHDVADKATSISFTSMGELIEDDPFRDNPTAAKSYALEEKASHLAKNTMTVFDPGGPVQNEHSEGVDMFKGMLRKKEVKSESLHHLNLRSPNFEEGSVVLETVLGTGTMTQKWPKPNSTKEGNVGRKEETKEFLESPRYDEVPGKDKGNWHSEEFILTALGLENSSQHKMSFKAGTSTDAKGLACPTELTKPFAYVPTAVLAYVPKEGIEESELKITSTEIKSALNEGLDKPKELKPELYVPGNLTLQLQGQGALGSLLKFSKSRCGLNGSIWQGSWKHSATTFCWNSSAL